MRDAFICDGVRTPVGATAARFPPCERTISVPCRCVRCWPATRSSTWNGLMM
jgi:hypothetical protein